MNESQILQHQLAAERRRFGTVIAACQSLPLSTRTAHPEFIEACMRYLQLAANRLAAPHREQSLARIGILLGGLVSDAQWGELLCMLQAALRQRFESLEPLLAVNVPAARLRAAVAVDADSIIEERVRYAQVRSSAPAGLALPAEMHVPA